MKFVSTFSSSASLLSIPTMMLLVGLLLPSMTLATPAETSMDDAGYVMCAAEESKLGYEWVDLRSTGGATRKGTNSWGPFQIGFPFEFYGTTYTQFGIAHKGYIHFSDSNIDNELGECGIPHESTRLPPQYIAVWNEEIGPWYGPRVRTGPDTYQYTNTGRVYYQTFDTACPIGTGKCLIVQYYDYDRRWYRDPEYNDFLELQIVLFDNNDIHLQYKSTADLTLGTDWDYYDDDELLNYIGVEHGITLVGIQGARAAEDTPSWGLEYTCETEDLYPGLVVSFSAPGNEDLCDVPTRTPTSFPSSAPTNNACVDRGMDGACFFNEIDQENRGRTSVCVKEINKSGFLQYRNACMSNTQLAGLGPGDAIDGTGYTVANCGCCDRCKVYKETSEPLVTEFAKYCTPAICTPADGANWQVCESWGGGGVNTIRVCVTHTDGTEEEMCVDPFFVPEYVSDVVTCGACSSAA